MILRPYQREAIENAKRVLAQNPVIVAPTGAGKTVTGATLVHELELPTLWLAHRRELVGQAADRLRSLGLSVGVVLAGHPYYPTRPVQVASVQTLARRELPPAKLIVIDECFPAGTRIDGRPIETIRRGEYVWSFNHSTGQCERRRVLRTFRSFAHSLITVRFSDGRTLTCTAGHPLYTPSGYIAAGTLRAGDLVANGDSNAISSLCDLQHDDDAKISERNSLLLTGVQSHGPRSSQEESDDAVHPMRYARRMRRGARAGTGTSGTSLLLDSLPGSIQVQGIQPDDGSDEPPSCVSQNASEKSDEAAGHSDEGFTVTEGNGTWSNDSPRQWPRSDHAGADAGRSTGLDNGVRGPDEDPERERISHVLQDRRGGALAEGRDRDRWQQPLCDRAATAGSEEGGMSCWSRVDHIEVHEQAGDAGFGRLCPDGFVYNIEVETNHNYFAEGFLVHNCHHTPGRSFRALLESYTGVPRIGLTATPFRLDGKPLGDLFGELVVAAYADDLVREGTLIEPRVYAPPPASLQGVKIRHGDFEQGELARRLDKSKLVGDIVQTWKTHADGRRTVVFAVNVEHSRHIIESFVAAGIPAEHLDGATPRAQRDAALDRLAKGQTLVLSNCCVLTEGWDLPALECAIIARPTASLCLHLQAVGRIMRAAVGKTGAIVLDHAGNFLRHGRVTRRLEYSLSGKVKPQTASIGTGLRTCPGCYRMVLSSRTHCPECGRDFTVASRDRMPETIDGELQEFTGIEPPDMTPPPSVVEQREFFEDLQVEARARGWKPGAVAMRYKERFGEWPTIVEIDGDRHIALPDSGDDVKEAVLEKFRAEADSRGYKPTYALARFKQIFGHWPQRRRKELVA